MVIGHFRPVILTPLGLLSGWPAEQVEASLLHELAHIRRHDCLINVLQRTAEGLLFNHQAIWWISHVIRDAHGHTSALASLELNRLPDRELAVAATGGSLMKRIQRLLNPSTPNGI